MPSLTFLQSCDVWLVRGREIWELWLWGGHEVADEVLLLAAKAGTCDVLEDLKGVEVKSKVFMSDGLGSNPALPLSGCTTLTNSVTTATVSTAVRGTSQPPFEDERRRCTGIPKCLVFRMGSRAMLLLLMLYCCYQLGKETWWRGPGSDSGKQLSAERNAWELHKYIRAPLSTGDML